MPQVRTDLTGNGANVHTHTQPMREMPIPGAETGKIEVVPPETRFLTAQQDPPRIVARDRAILPAILVFVISLTGGPIVTMMPIEDEWKASIGLAIGAINAAVVWYYRAIMEGEKDQARAERV